MWVRDKQHQCNSSWNGEEMDYVKDFRSLDVMCNKDDDGKAEAVSIMIFKEEGLEVQQAL